MILSFLRAEVKGSFENTFLIHFSKKKALKRSFDTNRGRRQGPVAARINVSHHISAIALSAEKISEFFGRARKV